MEDWLALPGEKTEQVEPAEKTTPVQLPAPAELDVSAPKISRSALAASDNLNSARMQYANAWKELHPRQKIYLRALRENNFSHAAAVKITNTTAGRRGEQFRRINWQTPSRWAKEDSAYKLVLGTLKADAVAQVASREDLLLRAHRIAEQAEEGEPIFGVDKDNDGFKVIGHEKKLDTALRANEQLMKATKVLGAEQVGSGGGAGPALVIQVVQRDGALLDVTPQGVTIDMPVPERGA